MTKRINTKKSRLFLSPLERFCHKEIVSLIHDHVRMLRSPYLYDLNMYGLWIPQKSLILIHDDFADEDFENRVILHEWLHAYEQMRYYDRSRDTRIDYWADKYYREQPGLAWYIRKRFKSKGF